MTTNDTGDAPLGQRIMSVEVRVELNEEQAYPVSLGVHQNVSSCWETAPSHLIKHLGKSGMVRVLFVSLTGQRWEGQVKECRWRVSD